MIKSVDVQKELVEYIRQAVEFGKEQVPLLVQETLTWGVVLAYIGIFLGLALLSGGLYAWHKFKPLYAEFVKEEYSSWSERMLVLLTLSILLGTIGVVVAFDNVLTLALIYSAPRLYLLDRLKG